MSPHARADEYQRSFEFTADLDEFFDPPARVVHSALSLPCENTTVLTVRLKKHPFAAVTDVSHWMKNSRVQRTKC